MGTPLTGSLPFPANPGSRLRNRPSGTPAYFFTFPDMHHDFSDIHPSGEKIYFSQGFNADNYFVMMDLDGGNWVNITEPNSFGYSEGGLQFNEDGSKIIFNTTEWVGYQNGSDLVIADSDGSNWTRLTYSENGEYFYVGTFNKYDNKIYYSYTESNGKFGIYKMDMDGTNRVQISNCSGVGIDEKPEVNISLIYHNPL
ncbi:MAG: hypothetical protein U5Q03_15980 [Bacteroidota bacterium]|nr:hypothetical protein [Bacteroidota bacterium]